MSDSKSHKVLTDTEWLATGNKDRRSKERRKGYDRRDMIRFDLEQGDRRSYQDRRISPRVS